LRLYSLPDHLFPSVLELHLDLVVL
jgi:hypothetical protein